MRLDSTAMLNIKYLEEEYGQLSNVPHDHNLIKKLRKYGQNKSIRMTDNINFYLSKENVKEIERLAKIDNKMRTTILRKILIDFINEPVKVDITIPFGKHERFVMKMPAKEYNDLKKLTKDYDCSMIQLTSYYLNQLIDKSRQEGIVL